jgi:hypothetical protein
MIPAKMCGIQNEAELNFKVYKKRIYWNSLPDVQCQL